MEESDEDMDAGKGNADDEAEEEDEIIESDVELEGEIVEADNDPAQKVLSFVLFQSFFFCLLLLCIIVLMEDLVICRWEIHRSRSLKRAVMPRS